MHKPALSIIKSIEILSSHGAGQVLGGNKVAPSMPCTPFFISSMNVHDLLLLKSKMIEVNIFVARMMSSLQAILLSPSFYLTIRWLNISLKQSLKTSQEKKDPKMTIYSGFNCLKPLELSSLDAMRLSVVQHWRHLMTGSNLHRLFHGFTHTCMNESRHSPP